MSDKNVEGVQELRGRRARRSNRKKLEDARSASSKLGFVIIIVCVAITSIAIFASNQVDAKSLPQPKKLSVDSLNPTALSTSWTCPISGDSTAGDTLLLSNPDTTRDARVEISTFDSDGVLVIKTKKQIEPGNYAEFGVDEVGANGTTSLLIESFASSIAVYRGLNLSDGPELIPCINSLDSQADFPNLETVRNSNSFLILANPFKEAVVVDITATLIDNSTNPPTSVFDEVRGTVIPAHGRSAIDLQKEFGRYSMLGLHVQSRSGFFAAETFLEYSGVNGVNGQTVISNARDISESGKLVWVGPAPTRIAAHNNSGFSHSLSVMSIAQDKRFINGEPEVVSAGATIQLTNSGLDFLARTTVVSIEDGNRKPTGIYASWIRAQGNSVSGGSISSDPSQSFIVPLVANDQVHLYNPSSKVVSVKLKPLGSKLKKTLKIEGKSYLAVSVDEFQIDGSSIFSVEADGKILVASSDPGFTRFAPGMAIRKK